MVVTSLKTDIRKWMQLVHSLNSAGSLQGLVTLMRLFSGKDWRHFDPQFEVSFGISWSTVEGTVHAQFLNWLLSIVLFVEVFHLDKKLYRQPIMPIWWITPLNDNRVFPTCLRTIFYFCTKTICVSYVPIPSYLRPLQMLLKYVHNYHWFELSCPLCVIFLRPTNVGSIRPKRSSWTLKEIKLNTERTHVVKPWYVWQIVEQNKCLWYEFRYSMLCHVLSVQYSSCNFAKVMSQFSCENFSWETKVIDVHPMELFNPFSVSMN